MSKSAFEIEMIDTLKRTIKEINDNVLSAPDYEELFQCTTKIAEEVNASSSFSYENDNFFIDIHNHCNRSNTDDFSKTPIQEIHISRYNDGSQVVDVHNYNYINYNGPVVIESANDVDVIYNSADDEDEIEDGNIDDENDDD